MPNQYMSQLSDYDQIRLVWTDLNGVGRGITMPADEAEHALEEGVGFANGVAELTLEPALLDDPKYGAEAGDMMAIPDPESVTPLEWTDDTAAVFTNFCRTSTAPLRPLWTHGGLRRVLDDLESEGFSPFAGIEMEFSVLSPDEDGEWAPFNDRCSYDLDALEQGADLIDDWREAMEAGGYHVLGAHQESQPGQYELNVEYDDPCRWQTGYSSRATCSNR